MEQIQFQHTADSSAFILADKGSRFGNSFIDTIVFYFLIFVHAMILDGWLGIMPEDGSNWFVLYFLFFYVMYQSLFEYFFGKTPGKFLTKTRVVKKDGSRPDFLNLIGRNAARLIPFDALTFLFSERGWHDQLSNTYVIADQKKN